MNDSTFPFISAIVMGLGATFTFDLWALCLKSVFRLAPANLCLIGRWIRYMPEGTFMHSNIASAPEKRAECTVGWIAHYLTGILFAFAFVALAGSEWLHRPGLVPAILFGVVTVLAPFLIMQPSFGLGFAASKTSNSTQARLRSVINHAVFGVGLYVFGWLASWLP